MSTEANSDKKESKKAAPAKKAYTLKCNVSINGKLHKKGTKVNLTEEGRVAFKRKHRI